jgi:hypothetical protein
MPAPNRTAQSSLARRLERVERQREDERDRLAPGGDVAAGQHRRDIAVARKSNDQISRNFRLRLISLER